MVTKKVTRKLVYETTKVAVKQSDHHTIPNVGVCTVENIHAPRKTPGPGRVTLKHPDGTKHDYSPGIIKAIWR